MKAPWLLPMYQYQVFARMDSYFCFKHLCGSRMLWGCGHRNLAYLALIVASRTPANICLYIGLIKALTMVLSSS
jgi:hypothetical protein